jgi:hypothetical protein
MKSMSRSLSLFVIDVNGVLLHYRSFAYETIKDRLPMIVTRIVDFLARHRATIAQEHGEVSASHFFFVTLKILLGSYPLGSRQRLQIMYCCYG